MKKLLNEILNLYKQSQNDNFNHIVRFNQRVLVVFIVKLHRNYISFKGLTSVSFYIK